ncbi:MAG: DUF1028 domain-containing protein [Sneathiellales bacterium]|nr:DUF1028 domain-containing protein [Sneathiellales bacterium]
MTLSVLAKDTVTGVIGCAAATGNIGVGGWVLRAAPDGGAVATQGLSVSPLWGDQALQMLRQKNSINQIFDDLIKPDSGKPCRQLAILDLDGKSRAFTGNDNEDYKGSLQSNQAIFTGNWLSGPTVLEDMRSFYEQNQDMEFGTRLLGCLTAAQEAGGDSRGLQSAAVKIVHKSKPPIDLRVDFDKSPIQQLIDIYHRTTSSPYADWLTSIPTLEDPHRC